MHRLRGELDQAESGYRRAHELGREPQPGLALTWLAQDRPEVAVAALRRALQAEPAAPLAQAALLAALVEAELATDQADRAAAAARDLAEVASRTSSPFLEAVAKAAAGTVQLAQGETSAALTLLRAARALFGELRMQYQEARVRVAIGSAARAAGDEGRPCSSSARRSRRSTSLAPRLTRGGRDVCSRTAAGRQAPSHQARSRYCD